MASKACEYKRQLLQDLLQVSSRVLHISTAHGEITSSQNGNEQTELDGMLQSAVHERDQTLRALESHQQEHGC